ncbi:MAG TPA: YbaK/EbsC family protein [Stellaceae bacterium]|jgi:prolyl-tRNA editing enzyme YbaK/EbsC (Cys-tRNA(Pro) deacylase)|nr:YbaK/EbsC family protein [Stellaceae bacterium]
MSEALSPAAQRVQEMLRAAGSEAQVRQLPMTARTAADAAAAIGCAVAQIAKSLVFKTRSGKPVLVIASGVNRVDETKIAAALGEPIGKADARFVRGMTGYTIGGVAPIGHETPPRIFIDQDLRQHRVLWAAAGHPHAVFPLTAEELEHLTRGTVIEVK